MIEQKKKKKSGERGWGRIVPALTWFSCLLSFSQFQNKSFKPQRTLEKEEEERI